MRTSENKFLALLERLSYTHFTMAKKKNKAAQELGKLGGLKGGPARAKALSSERKSAIARKAAIASWVKRRQKS
jgi:hypothetical protein